MKLETMKALIAWWMQGNKDKSAKVSAERARDLLVEGIIRGDWEEQLNLSIPKIKAFFSLTPKKMDEMSRATSSEEDDQNFVEQVEQEELTLIVEEEANEAIGLEEHAGGD